MPTKIQLRRGTAAQWTSSNPLLANGEVGIETDSKQFKVGDGSTYWNSLAYASVSEGTVEGMIASHEAASDPHPQYETSAEAQAKVDSHANRSDNPHSVTKTQVGLGNVDNTSDANKPISTATQIALDLKIDTSKISAANGVASLDSSGKVPVDQLPNSVMEFKGAYDPSTNTPSLSDGSGNAGDIYRISVAGSRDFGSGSIAFFVGDLVVYSGSVWQRSPAADGVISVNGYQGAVTLTKADIGLGLVDNTSDTNKPVSTATQNALDLKANSADVYTKTQSDTNFEPKNANIQSHISDLSNPHSVTKAQIGLDSVDNVSAANLRNRATHTGTQTASTISDFTSAVQAITIDASKIDGGVVSNAEFATLDGINTASTIQTQLDNKESSISAGTSSQYWRGDKTWQTLDKTAVGLSNVDNISAVDLRDRSTHTGNETTLTWSEGEAPVAPALGLTTYALNSGGRNLFGQIGKSGVSYSFQPFFARNRITYWQPNAGATTSTSFGAVFTTNGTATARTVATTNFFTWMRRLGFVSAATANQSSGNRVAVANYGLGNTAGAGGFHMVVRCGISDAALVATGRLFVGLTSTTAAIGNVNPSTLVNSIGFIVDSNDTTISIYSGGAVAGTKTSLGANFPANTTNTSMYEFVLFAAPNSSTVYWQAINLSTGVSSSGSLTSNLPTNTTLLGWQVWRHNGGTAAAVGIDIASMYLETDN